MQTVQTAPTAPCPTASPLVRRPVWVHVLSWSSCAESNGSPQPPSSDLPGSHVSTTVLSQVVPGPWPCSPLSLAVAPPSSFAIQAALL